MPLIRSIASLADGFQITTTTGGTFTISSADLSPAQKAMTPAQIETIANTFLSTRLNPLGMFVAVHLTSVVPLLGTSAVANEPLTGAWWLG